MNTHITVDEPMIIGPRLLPALRVGDSMLSIEPVIRNANNRLVVRWFLDTGGKSYSAADLRTGVGDKWSSEQARRTMIDLLGFLEACAASEDGGENADLFQREVRQWAKDHQNDIAILRCEMEGE